MIITQFELAQIAGQASSLFESLSNEWLEADIPQVNNEEQISNERLNHWCQTITQGNWEKFQQRLQWDGIDIDTLRLTIGKIPLADSQNLPAWTETLREIIQTVSELTFDENESKILTTSENPLPFEEILLPVLCSKTETADLSRSCLIIPRLFTFRIAIRKSLFELGTQLASEANKTM
jgi:hypothetical protein